MCVSKVIQLKKWLSIINDHKPMGPNEGGYLKKNCIREIWCMNKYQSTKFQNLGTLVGILYSLGFMHFLPAQRSSLMFQRPSHSLYALITCEHARGNFMHGKAWQHTKLLISCKVLCYIADIIDEVAYAKTKNNSKPHLHIFVLLVFYQRTVCYD